MRGRAIAASRPGLDAGLLRRGGAAPAEVFASCGWTDQEWAAATERLAARGWVDRGRYQPTDTIIDFLNSL